MQSGRFCTRKIYNVSSHINSTVNKRNSLGIKDVQIVVVGAGLAGLSATNHLLKNGFHKVYLLEATNRYGGRVNTKQFGDVYCELGAKWIPIDASKHTIYELTQQASHLEKQVKLRNEMFYVDPFGQKINNKIAERIDKLFRRLCGGINVKDKFHNGNMFDLNSVHAYFQAESANLIQNNFNEADQRIARGIFNSLFKEFGSILGCCLEYVSIEHITKLSVHNTNPIYIPNGLDNVLNHLTCNIAKEQMRIGKPVGIINWSCETKPFVGCMDGSIFNAEHIICTLPLGVLKTFGGIMFTPPLPKEKEDAIKNIGFGNPVKIYFEYTKQINSWLMSNIRPLGDFEEFKNERKWTDQIIEISRLPPSNRVLEILIGGGYYEDIERLPDTELVNEVTKLLRNLLNNSKIPYPASMLRSDWNTSACYLGGRPYFSTKSSSNDVAKLSMPLGEIPRLLFAGDATTLNGFGTIDGARLSGIREAERIINYYAKRL